MKTAIYEPQQIMFNFNSLSLEKNNTNMNENELIYPISINYGKDVYEIVKGAVKG